jgi:hypothetical protein
VNFGALVRKKSKFPVDGMALVVGIACLLKQFHPSYTRKIFSYLGQFIRTSLSDAFADVDTKPEEIPREIVNTLIFIDQMCTFTSTPRQLVYDYVPAYIFDALILSKQVKK